MRPHPPGLPPQAPRCYTPLSPPATSAAAEQEAVTIRTKVGVVGSAGGILTPESLRKAHILGREIAEHDAIIITGACPGLPHEAVLGALEVGTLILGISPAHSLQEHIDRYHSPWEEYDALIYTGSGLMGREIDTIRSCDIVVVVGGRSGTLGEFAIAYDEAKLIGVLQGTGGVADHIDEIVAVFDKDTGADIVYSDDPRELIHLSIAKHKERIERGVAFTARLVDG